MKDNSTFKSTRTIICETCYLTILKDHEMGGDKEWLKPIDFRNYFLGTGRQMPEVIHYRDKVFLLK